MGFSDNFDDNSQDTAKWSKATTQGFNASVTVLEQNQRLEIQPLTSAAGSNYNAYQTVSAYNLTGASVVVQVKQACSGSNADTQLLLEIDANNLYAFVVEAGVIYFKKRVASTNSSTNATYSGTTHKWWRLRHDAAADTINWDTSTDGITWTNRRSVARDLTITAMKIELCAGTFASDGAPGLAEWDDFSLRSGTPPFIVNAFMEAGLV